MQSTDAIFEQVVRSGFARFMTWAAPLMVLVTIADAALLHVGPVVVALDLFFLVLICLVRLAFTRGVLSARASNPAALILAGVLVANTLVAMRLSGDLAYTIDVVVALLVASSLMTSAVWFLVTGVLSLVGWQIFSPHEGGSSEAVRLIGLIATVTVGVLMLRHRMELLARMIRAARSAAARTAEVEVALTRTTEEIRARHQVEDERESLRGQFLHAQKMEGIGTLAAGVVHDMNNVLSAAVTLGSVIRDQVSGPAREDTDNLLLVLERGRELTSSLVTFSRKQDETAAPEPAVVRGAMESVARLVRRTLPKSIVVEVDPSSPELAVACDAAQLSHALLNLCINASDAMNGKGTIRIAARDERVASAAAERLTIAPGEYVALSVQDSGCGMDEETRRRATEPFFTTKGAKGSGLGLAMVSGTVRNHGGTTVIDSTPGRGTTVTLYLPRAPDVVGAATALASSDPLVVAAHARPHVLVVDDDGLARRAARRLLERLGYTVGEAPDGSAALRAYRELGPFDVVLLDLAMPGMDGLECLMKLKELDPHAHVVIFSSATGARERTISAGAEAFVPKPLVPADLDRVLTACLQQTN